MALKNFTATFACAFMVVATPALATEYSDNRGGWDIGDVEDGCGMSMKFEGPGDTVLVFMKMANGDLFLHVTNENWSAKEGERYEISYYLNDINYGGVPSIGVSKPSRKGFLASFNPDFERAFASGNSLRIYMGEDKIDHLSLAGTTIALASLNRCLVGVRSRISAAAREKARWASIPKDPFAPKPANGITPPIPLGNIGSWTSTNDYPSIALRNEWEGLVGFTLTVDSAGTVKECVVDKSSGHIELDEVTCANVRRRARFKPAADAQGAATEGVYSGSTRWILPKG